MKPKASISTIARTAARLSHDPDAAREATVRRDAGPFANVLVGVDGTPRGRDAIALAEWLRDEQGRLTLAHVVVGRTASYAGRRPASSWKEACRMLEREREAVGVGGALIGTVAPSVASGLHRLAEDRRADLLVVGSSARGPFGRLLRGDDTRGSLSGAPCAVAVAPLGYWAKGRKPIETIGVAYNATPAADAALAVARDIATHHGAELRALTVVWPTGSSAASAPWWALAVDADVHESRVRLRSLAGVEGDISFGLPEQELATFADEVDLLVVGSRGHGPVRRLVLGSTSAELARSARRPVLIVPRAATSCYRR